MPLQPLPIPGCFITGTDTDVGKTIVAGAIANWFYRQGRRVSVLKPVASGCEKRREGLVSQDAELLAHLSNTHHPLDLICPNCYAEPLAPSIAARRAKKPVDIDAINRSVRIMSADSDFMIVEGAGGVLTPFDDKHFMADVAVALKIPALLVARPGLGTINHTLLSIEALRSRNVKIAGVVINFFPTDNVGTAEETSWREIEKLGKVNVLTFVPHEPFNFPNIGPGVIAAIDQVDWAGKLKVG